MYKRQGLKYGIPFAIHSRSSFGVKGSKIATLLRGVPALFWFGIATWIGADAIAMVTQTMFGFGNTMVYFFIFQILQVILAASGIQSIKWFESSMAIIIVLILSLIHIYSRILAAWQGRMPSTKAPLNSAVSCVCRMWRSLPMR